MRAHNPGQPPRSKALHLLAKRQAAELAQLRKSHNETLKNRKAVEGLLRRVEGLLSHHSAQECTQKPGSVAQWRERRALGGRLALEAERSRARLHQIRKDQKAAALTLARMDHRKRGIEKAAQEARQAERTALQERAEAAMPTRTRRGA